MEEACCGQGMARWAHLTRSQKALHGGRKPLYTLSVPLQGCKGSFLLLRRAFYSYVSVTFSKRFGRIKTFTPEFRCVRKKSREIEFDLFILNVCEAESTT